ncbi:hypothetical protein MW871_06015 [Flavobacterium sp. I-SCBP12n]|uniref:DUF7793 domain-containing protein n=1 Tax=Flavobacterium pygoscelis TaxID=2893176 RepID=A0A9X2BMX8_9FLAO|nr:MULTISPECIES: hypothetical protein [Flavobacterium]MCK8141445.1 hypothetical protein [Flavobacterium pygoscelis]
MKTDIFENEFARFWIDGSILFFIYKDNVSINLAAAECIVANRIQFQNNIAYPVFCDARGIVSMDKPARDYLAQSGSFLTLAVGLLVNEQVSVMVSYFYLKINKPIVPTRLFTDQLAAIVFVTNYI